MSGAAVWWAGRWWIVAGATLVVAVVAIVVVIALGSGNHRPASPSAAARAWADAHFRHDLSTEGKFTCPAGSSAGDLLNLTSGAVSGYTAGNAVSDGANAWTVQLIVHQVGGDSTFPLHVIRSDGRYLVC